MCVTITNNNTINYSPMDAETSDNNNNNNIKA